MLGLSTSRLDHVALLLPEGRGGRKNFCQNFAIWFWACFNSVDEKGSRIPKTHHDRLARETSLHKTLNGVGMLLHSQALSFRLITASEIVIWLISLEF